MLPPGVNPASGDAPGGRDCLWLVTPVLGLLYGPCGCPAAAAAPAGSPVQLEPATRGSPADRVSVGAVEQVCAPAAPAPTRCHSSTLEAAPGQ
eukprot:15436140-Alexandrium_andersonii.AAC.1